MSQALPEVRIATRADEEELLAMVRRMWAEGGLMPLNEDKVRTILHRCYDKTGAIIGVIGEPGQIEASICMIISEWWYSAAWHLEELWNFVDEPYRRSRNAQALIEFGKSCSDKMAIPFFIGVLTNNKMAEKVRLYRRSLGAPTGAFFVHNAKWKTEPMPDHRELQGRLKELAQTCAERSKSVPFSMVRKEIAPVLREAADAIATEDNMWGTPRTNGSAHAGHD